MVDGDVCAVFGAVRRPGATVPCDGDTADMITSRLGAEDLSRRLGACWTGFEEAQGSVFSPHLPRSGWRRYPFEIGMRLTSPVRCISLLDGRSRGVGTSFLHADSKLVLDGLFFCEAQQVGLAGGHHERNLLVSQLVAKQQKPEDLLEVQTV